MEADGDKQKGRFLKRNSRIYTLVDVQEFSFEEICKTTLAYPDNPNNNVLHTRLHEQDQLNKLVQPPASLMENLLDPQYRAPVIMPRDFTDDWIEEKNKAKRRSVYDEEDFEEEDKIKKEVAKQKTLAEKAAKAAIAAGMLPPPELAVEKTENAGAKTAAENQDALKDLQSAQKELRPMEIVNATAQPQHNEDEKIEKKQSESIPEPAPIPAPAPVPDISSEASEHLKNPASEAQEDKENIQKGEDLARAVNNTQNLMQEILKLKPDILKNAQSNFYELAKALCESLIEREVKLHPETFVSIIEKAIAQTVAGDEFIIKVHPKFIESLASVDIGPLKAKMQADSDMEESTFKIETKLGTVNSGVKKIVDQLLEQADLSLFEDKPKNET